MAGEWREIALWDIAEYINGRATKPSELASNGVPVIKIAELNRGITEETDRIPPQLVQEKHWVSHGDLLFAWSGSVGIYRYTGSKAALNQHIFRVVGKPGIDQGFLRYLLLSCMPVFHLHVQDKRTTMGHVTKQDLQRIKVRVPPLQEQRAIAHILGTLDDKIELNRRMSQTLEAMAQALFKAWFVDFEPVRAKLAGRWQRGVGANHDSPLQPGLPAHLYDLFPDRLVDSELGEIPEGWEVKKLSDLCTTQYGYTTSAVDEPVGPKFLRVTDINKRNWIEWGDVPYCAIEPDARASYSLQVGDLVVARMADPGKSAIIEEDIDAVFASYLVRLKTPSLAHSYYLYGFLKSDLYAEYAEGAKSGSVQANMNAKVIVGASLTVPPKAVLDAFLREVLPLRQRLVANVRESRTLAALRDALLPKLISGEIRVKDAERFLKERGL